VERNTIDGGNILTLKNSKMRRLNFLFLIFIWTSCAKNPSMNYDKMSSINLFKTYITGDFNNQAQIDQEIKSGNQIHPLAVHVNRVFDSKLKNAPKVNGFWILEESYYTKPGQTVVEEKPYLFLFEAAEDGKVKLTPYTLPKDKPTSYFKNSNVGITIDFNTIQPSPTFKPAYYLREGNLFKLNAPNELPNGMRFTLIETITVKSLEVMELLEKDGKSLTPYSTPILYDRVSKL
jgi:hypothetical protein